MERIGESATLKVMRLAGELRAQGMEVLDLGVGEPDFPSPPPAVEAAREALSAGYTKYSEASGLPALRNAVAAALASRYGALWTGRDVVVTAGAKMALFDLALVLLEPGDEAVIPSPCWVSFPEQVRFAGAEAVLVPTSGADRFEIHAEALIAAFTPRTRAVILNSPANPTGGIISAADLRRVTEACVERGIALVADETYDRFFYPGPVPFASAASLSREFPETVVLVGSMSKTYSMTGWRLGYVCGPPSVIRAVQAIQSHSTSNATTFAMKGAETALAEGEPFVAAMIEEFRQRRDLLIEGLNALPGVRCLPPAGAFYAFPDVSGAFRPGRADSTELAEHLLRKAGVAVVPGAAFGSDLHVRMSFACSRETLEKALARMAEALAS
ncbi:MAG: pyridoxal phosphate-dependent aminotransferase [Thermoanaerobaculia bacterium]